MFIGTEYYRPPNPRPEDWDNDLKLIKDCGLELVRAWVYWARVEIKEGVWVWDEYDRLAELADKHGLKFFVQLMCDGSPYWFEQKYPEACYLNSAGQRVEFQARGSMSIGGAPGPCFHNPTAKKYAEEFMRRAAEHYLDLSNLYGYDLWNEIWMAECFCEHTQAQFRRFLKQRYGNIKSLNGVWQRSYSDFEEVYLPKRGVYADMFDKYEFEQWSRQQLMQWRYDTVRSVDKKRPLVSHYLGHCSLFVPDHDPWLAAQPVDAWGTSSYDMDLGSAALTFQATLCASEGKPWWLSEQTGGRTWSGSGDNLRTNEFLKSFNVMAMAFGAEASIYWQWRPEIFGQESPHFGLTNIGGEPTERTEMLKNFTARLKRHQELFENMEFEPPEIGILWEPRTIMYEQQSRGARGSGNWLWWENFVGWHRALLDKGYNAQILHAPTLASKGVPKNIRLLLAPMQVMDRNGLTPTLSAWVKSGGILVAGPWYGMYDEHSYVNRRCPSTDLFGVKQQETYYHDQPRLEFTANDLIPLGYLYGQKLTEDLDLEADDAQILAVFGTNAALTSRPIGSGKAIYIGSFLGNRYNYVNAPQLGGFLDWLAQHAKIAPMIRATGGCFGRTAKSGKSLIIFLINPQKSGVVTWLTFPAQTQGQLTDLLTDVNIGEVGSGSPVSISLAAEDSRILRANT